VKHLGNCITEHALRSDCYEKRLIFNWVIHVVVAMSRYLIKERHPNYLSNEVDLIENLVLSNDSSRQGSLVKSNVTFGDVFYQTHVRSEARRTTNRLPFLKSSSGFLILHLIKGKCIPLNMLLQFVSSVSELWTIVNVMIRASLLARQHWLPKSCRVRVSSTGF
jgi:hypothetical protein